MPPVKFQIDISRTYKNKTGYDNGYRLNTSFKTETHTERTFIDNVIRAGWPYTMVHQKRDPKITGAYARGVKTPKHIENFVSMQVMTFDDDSGEGNVVLFWLKDEFFKKYGWAFVESVNSTPDKQKGHPTFIFDKPITDPALYKECLQAFCTAYPRLDWLVNIDRTIYNAEGATVHMIGNVCPFDVFEKTILEPYRKAEAEKQAAIDAEKARKQAEWEKLKAQGKTISSSLEEAWLSGWLNWLFDKVANTQSGGNPSRNGAIYWAGRSIAGAKNTTWAQPYGKLFIDIERRIVEAAAANGYLQDYANGKDAEILRIFNRGIMAGGVPLDEPRPTEQREPPERIIDDAGNDISIFLIESADDEGNAQCMNEIHGKEFMHCSAYGWLHHNGQFWQNEIGEAVLQRTTAEMLKERRMQAVIADREAIIKAAKPSANNIKNSIFNFRSIVTTTVADFDKSPHLLNCQNGVVDLRTGDIVPHDLSQRFTYCVPTKYEPNAYSEVWENFLLDVMNNDRQMIDYMQEAMGYTLTGITSEECLFYMYGQTRSGKGTFTETILSALGREPIATEVDFGTFTRNRDRDAQNFDLAPLKPCRVVMASESNQYGHLNEAVIKRITGGNDIMCAFKHKDHFTYRPQFTIWLSSNYAPKADVDDDAVWIRVRVIRFPNCYAGREDRSLKRRLRQPINLEGVLSWIVRGSISWYGKNEKGLHAPQQVIDETQRARTELDFVAQWVDECLEVDEESFIPNSALYSSYETWCKDNGVTPRKLGRLTSALKKKGYRAGERSMVRIMGVERQKRGLKGFIVS